MPYVIVKLWPDRSEEEKAQLTNAIVRDDTITLHACEDSVSVVIEEISSDVWSKQVFHPDILAN